jgi:hypothetical protein
MGGIDTYVFTTTNLVTYYVYVAFSGNGGYPNANSGFDISRTCAVPPPASLSDCVGGTSICNDSSFVGNASGSGNIVDLNSGNDGCLNTEHQTSWYFFEAQTAGTLEFLIDPVNGTDDYDFAMWGPYPSGSTPASICPPAAPPVRCSYAAGAPPAGGTGLQTGAGDNSEGTGGDHYVDPLFLNVGDVYILVIDNYSGSSSPFDMDLTLSGGLDLDCSQLPVELLSFTGYNNETENILNWTTTTEINNDHFDIEKSLNGVTFQKIGEVEGNGNSYVNINYSFVDANPTSGTTYYRLKQVDFNGAFEYSNTLAIRSVGIADVAIFPNPTAGKLNFNFVSKEAGDYQIVVSDLSKVIYNENHYVNSGNQIVRFDLFQELAPGFYMIKITDQDGNVIKMDKVIRK